MRTLIDKREMPVAYGQIYVESQADPFAEMGECFEGQQNGLCGAAVPGHLFLITGMHTGDVVFTVELHDSAPPLDDGWEDVVEASFRPEGKTVLLCWGGEPMLPLDLDQTDYRVRYSSKGRDQAAGEARWAGEPEIDSYLLQFWPQPPQPDKIVKQTSDSAAYWHRYARNEPMPSPFAVPADLAEAFARADPELLRAAAKWLVRRTFVEAELADVAWIAPALAAMDRGEPLPPPFDDQSQVWDLVFSDDSVPKKTVVTSDGRLDDRRVPAAALRALNAYCFADQEPLALVRKIFEEAAWAVPAATLAAELLTSNGRIRLLHS